jgi:threonylcarbamoyladenosine tRNA methylthiotransferase MtaB
VKLYLRTFGCRANQYDGEAVRAMAERGGVQLVDDPALADTAVFNSCAVTADAVADLRQQVRRASRANSTLRTVIMGCAPGMRDANSRASLDALPSVASTVVGADLAAVADAIGLDAAAVDATTAHQTGARALLRIQDGCDEHCTFCVATLARGASRSRAAADLIAEAARLAEHHAEIVITGVHVGSYGLDVGSSLGVLVEQLVRAVPAVRFRLTSIEATEVDERLAELLAGAPRQVAPYLHAPLQSGSDRVLRRMGRHWYTARSYAAAVERIAARTPVLGLGADVVTGFPGETGDDHAATMALVEALPFTGLHVFPFSPRPGTAAERLADPVAPAVARVRARELRQLAARKAEGHRRARAGGSADLVLLGRRADGAREGLTEDYLTVLAADPTLPRGARYDALLHHDGGTLVARAADRAAPDHAGP